MRTLDHRVAAQAFDGLRQVADGFLDHDLVELLLGPHDQRAAEFQFGLDDASGIRRQRRRFEVLAPHCDHLVERREFAKFLGHAHTRGAEIGFDLVAEGLRDRQVIRQHAVEFAGQVADLLDAEGLRVGQGRLQVLGNQVGREACNIFGLRLARARQSDGEQACVGRREPAAAAEAVDFQAALALALAACPDEQVGIGLGHALARLRHRSRSETALDRAHRDQRERRAERENRQVARQCAAEPFGGPPARRAGRTGQKDAETGGLAGLGAGGAAAIRDGAGKAAEAPHQLVDKVKRAQYGHGSAEQGQPFGARHVGFQPLVSCLKPTGNQHLSYPLMPQGDTFLTKSLQQ